MRASDVSKAIVTDTDLRAEIVAAYESCASSMRIGCQCRECIEKAAYAYANRRLRERAGREEPTS